MAQPGDAILYPPEPPLHTERLLLRPLTLRDLPAMMPIHTDESVNRYLPHPTWQDEADARAWYQRVHEREQQGEAIRLAICDRRSGTIHGTVLLFGYEPENDRAEIGYALGRASWRQGIGREAVGRLIAWAFDELAIRRLDAKLDPRNSGSAALLESLGFQREGCLRQRELNKGELVDLALYGLLRSEWTPP